RGWPAWWASEPGRVSSLTSLPPRGVEGPTIATMTHSQTANVRHGWLAQALTRRVSPRSRSRDLPTCMVTPCDWVPGPGEAVCGRARWQGSRVRPERRPAREQGEGDADDGDPGRAVQQVVVAGRHDGEGHECRVDRDERPHGSGTGRAAAIEGDQKRPADVHAPHGRVGVEPDAHERSGVVAREPDGVGDAQAADQTRRRGGEEDEDHGRDRERHEQRAPKLPVEGPVAPGEPDERERDQGAEADHVVRGEEAGGGGEAALDPALAGEAERPRAAE